MKTIKEMIEVMQAYLRGEQIETCRLHNPKGWHECKSPKWKWHECDYRVKEKVYVPFENAEEFFEAQSKHCESIRSKENGVLHHAFVNKWGDLVLFDDKGGTTTGRLRHLLGRFEFLDGTPCGKEVNV